MQAKNHRNGSGKRRPLRHNDAGLSLAALRQRAQERAAELVRLARETGEHAVTDRKARAAAHLSGVSVAVRRAAEKLQDQDGGIVAGYVEEAAGRVEQVAEYLEAREIEELIDDAADLARRQPAWFLGGMFLAGVATAAFFKAAAPASDSAPDVGAGPNHASAANGDAERN